MGQAKKNKENYLAAKAAFNARDLDACVAFYAPHHRVASRAPTGEAPTIRRFFEQTIATWPDIVIRVEHAVAEDDWVNVWDLHRFDAEGRMVESWNLMDALSIAQQLAAPAHST